MILEAKVTKEHHDYAMNCKSAGYGSVCSMYSWGDGRCVMGSNRQD